MDALKNINTATNLDALCAALNTARNELGYEIMKDVDLTGLDTFGGDEPSDLTMVYSWDATRLLVHTGCDEFHVIDRADHGE